MPPLIRLLAAVLLIGFSMGGCFQVAGLDEYSFVKPARQRLSAERIDKLDILLVVDNSSGLDDVQDALDVSLEAFLGELINPRCLDASGVAATNQPAGPFDPCPAGSQREFQPMTDIHVGVITSSLGDHGGDLCDPNEDPQKDTQAHLQVLDSNGELVDTHQGAGFLAWDPEGQMTPPGETDSDVFLGNLSAILSGVSETGCGFEAQLEAWYRFAVDPDPYENVIVEANGTTTPVGTDQVVLAQRAAFLREDSLVAIVVLSDENDCSIRDGGQAVLAAKAYPYVMPKPRAACATDPNDPCCRSCAQMPGPGCDDSQDDCVGSLDPSEDDIELRCFDQKRRFGIDFLWPIDRYITGLTSPEIADRHGNVVANPLLAERDPGLVLFTAIVGVPWQDIARRTSEGVPDLDAGEDAARQAVGGVQNAAELVANGTWNVILGDPDNHVPPIDPFMVESIDPRAGNNPITGDPITLPGQQDNAINGHEVSVPDRDMLQHACIFDLPESHYCPDPLDDGCACSQPTNDDPVCNPEDPTLQERGAAKPGIRHLQLVKALGPQGVVGTACWQHLDDPAGEPAPLSFGYKAAFMSGIVGRLKASLRDQLCLSDPQLPDETGRVPCSLIEARATEPGTCTCGSARSVPGDEHRDAVQLARSDPLYQQEGWNCFCLVDQVGSDVDLAACQSYVSEPVVNEFGQLVNGWCLVDAMLTPPIGNPVLAASCPAGHQRVIRLVGEAAQRPGTALFLHCE